MKDLDFDELDKAVNSLMTSVPKTPPASSAQDEEKTLDIKPTLSDDEPLSFDKLDTATAEAVNEASTTEEQKNDAVATTVANIPSSSSTPPPATRRSGRFMDVVHPSSDMKKVTTSARPVSRQGVAVEPAIPTRPDAPRASTPFASSPETKGSEQSEKTESVTEDSLSSGGWPDPLEMTDFKDDVVPKEEEWSVSNSSSDHGTEPSPLVSPFLPDTKVEKRPLGSGALAGNEESDGASDSKEPHEDKTVDDPDDQLPANPGDVALQLPEELQSDMMNVEADTHMGVPKTELTHPSDEKLLESGLLPQEPDTQPIVSTPTGPVSIPQQYREEPSTSDQKNGGIYDTDSYHRPLEHPAKKKSGWMWIVWIVVILLVGAGAGAGLYFSGLIK
jgi:hypothetical protein